MTLLAKVYLSGAVLSFVGGMALLAEASDPLGWGAFVFSGILLYQFNEQPEK